MSFPLPDFGRGAVLVAGDVMLDRYWHGDCGRISPEAPVPVVHVRDAEARPGGAANVAVNAARLGASVRLLAPVGDDDAADLLAGLLAAAGVDAGLQRHSNGETVTKLRVISRHQQLIRLDFENAADQSPLEFDDEPLSNFGAVVISDYAKGALANAGRLIQAARQRGVPVIVDPKGRDFSRYRGASVLTPNLNEFEAVMGEVDAEPELEAKARDLCRQLDFEALLVTRGEAGMSLVPVDGGASHLPAVARDIFDVTGAGDTVVAVLAAALSVGVKLADAVRFANTAAGLVVAKVGTASVTRKELELELERDLERPAGVVDISALQTALSMSRRHGERIIMTNGCFDILHAGHVTYLEEAKSLGDRLVVAVNDDASVSRLKGAQRPVNGLSSRMTMLAALRCVDWVVSFHEDTPERVIRDVRPDVLVKGGDNDPDNIPGADFVRGCGGQVQVCGYVDGHSTTELIGAIRAPGDRGE